MKPRGPRQRACAHRLGISEAVFRDLEAAWARRLQVSPEAARALIAAVHHLGDEGTAIPAFQVPMRAWAEVAGLTVPELRRAVEELEGAGRLVVLRRSGRAGECLIVPAPRDGGA